MNKAEIRVPKEAMPKKDPVNPCPCQSRPVKLTLKTGIVRWMKQEGETVLEGEVLCEGEVEKKALEFRAPCSGILTEICIQDEEKFTYGDLLGYIAVQEEQDGTEN